jgi:hypothetical protein
MGEARRRRLAGAYPKADHHRAEREIRAVQVKVDCSNDALRRDPERLQELRDLVRIQAMGARALLVVDDEFLPVFGSIQGVVTCTHAAFPRISIGEVDRLFVIGGTPDQLQRLSEHLRPNSA